MAASDDSDPTRAAAPPLGSDPDLKSLVEDLVYPSEDDRPFELIEWPAGPVSARAAVAAHASSQATVNRMTPAEFFDPLRDTTDAERFAALHREMAAHLSDLTAFRVSDGSAEVDIYVIGRTRGDRWTGVHTVAVET